MIDAEQIRRFCSALFGGPDGCGDERLEGLNVAAAWSLPGKKTHWRPGHDLGAIVSAITDLAEAQSSPGGPIGIYTGPGMTRARKTEHQRTRAHQIDAIPGFWADIDFMGGPHEAKNYPPDFEAAVALASATGAVPTAIIRTGHGIHAWWLFHEPLIIESDAEREDLYRSSLDWSSTLRHHAERLGGWKIDSVFDLTRVLRVPGTMNLRVEGDPRLAEIHEMDETRRYEPDDLRELFADQAVLDGYATGVAGAKAAELDGVDLPGIWRMVNSAEYQRRDYTPDWLAAILEIDGEAGVLSLTWAGKRNDLKKDQSSYDAAIVRFLHDYGLPIPRQIEALMCARIRSGEKVDKAQRADYIARTLGFVQASVALKGATNGKVNTERDKAFEQAASGRLASTVDVEPEPDPQDYLPPTEPPPEDGPPDDPLASYVDALIEHDAAKPTVAEKVAAAEDQVRQEHQAADGDREPPVTESEAEPLPDIVEDEEDIWGTRGEGLVSHMEALTELLLPESFVKAGFQIWRIERLDQGEAARGRVGVRVPVGYDWPDSNRPTQYRVNRPLWSEFHKRGDFDTPRGFRTALQHDCLIPAAPVAKKEEWAALIDRLVPYWMRDSTGSDLAYSVHGWLMDYLLDHPPTPFDKEALDLKRPFLADHKNWGVEGCPQILFALDPFLTFISTRPGGVKGRLAKTVLNHLKVVKDRRRMTNGKGKTVRGTWNLIEPEEFSRGEWLSIIESTRETLLARKDRMHIVPGETA